MDRAEPVGSSSSNGMEQSDGLRFTVMARLCGTQIERRCDAIKEGARATTARGASPVRRALSIAPIMRGRRPGQSAQPTAHNARALCLMPAPAIHPPWARVSTEAHSRRIVTIFVFFGSFRD
jgi:hypothetical protein